METIDKAMHSAHEAVDKLSNANQPGCGKRLAKKGRTENAEKRLMENCRTYVRDNPISSLGIAVAAGFLY